MVLPSNLPKKQSQGHLFLNYNGVSFNPVLSIHNDHMNQMFMTPSEIQPNTAERNKRKRSRQLLELGINICDERSKSQPEKVSRRDKVCEAAKKVPLQT